MAKEMPMPRYRCHKEVMALKIAGIITYPTIQPAQEDDGSRLLTIADLGFEPVRVDFEYMCRHRPEVGGYYVVYADGYKSFSPAKAFEEGYTKI